MATIGNLWINVKSNTSGLSKGLGKAKGMLGKFGKFAASPAGLATAAFAGLTAAIALTVKVLGAALKEFMAFEAGMAEVKSILTDVSDSDFAKLEDSAKKLGATTAFTAEEASGGMANLARAGFATNEILAATPAVLNLASATGMELATAADIAAVAVRGFGLEASETAHVADVLALAASKTNTTVEGLGDAMSYVAPVANQLGFSIEETTAMLGKLADAGIKNSKGGTALRTMMLKLGSTIEKEGTQAFYDYLEAQHSVTENMEKFGKIGVTAAGVLSGVVDETKELTVAMEEAADVVDTMAKTRLDTLAGDVTLFESAVSGLKVAIGEQLSPTMRDAVQAATDFVNILTESMGRTKQSTAEAEAGMNAFRWVLVAVGSIIIFITDKFKRFYEIGAFAVNGIKTLFNGLLTSVMVLVKNLVEAGAAVKEFFGGTADRSGIEKLEGWIEDWAADTVQAGADAGANFNAAFGEGLIAPYKNMGALAEGMSAVGETAGAAVMVGMEGVFEAGVPKVVEKVVEETDKLNDTQMDLIDSGTKLNAKLEEQIKYFGMSNAEMLIAKAVNADVNSEVINGTLALELKLQALKDNQKAQEDATKQTEQDAERLKSAAESIIKSLRSPMEVFNDEQSKLQEMKKKSLLTLEQYDKALAKLKEKTADDLEINIVTKGVIEGLQTALGTVKVAGQVSKTEQIAEKSLRVAENMQALTSAISSTTSESAESSSVTASKADSILSKLGNLSVGISWGGLQNIITNGVESATLNIPSSDMTHTEYLLGEVRAANWQELTELKTQTAIMSGGSGSPLT